jgi:transaldolase/glucose-6-phosphate isomerase
MTSTGKKTSSRRAAPQSDFRVGVYEANVADRLADWKASGFAHRLWAKDPSLWGSAATPEVANRLGWLVLPETMRGDVAEIQAFAAEVKEEGFTQAVVLGMGGSSLAPDVFQRTFGRAAGSPGLLVLDSTHPAAVASVERAIDLNRTIFLVSSKSGTTIEPLSFYRYFWAKLRGRTNSPGRQFAAITDPGTPLAALGRERGFRRVFLAPPDVGGRFSALTPFGLVPAALAGVDILKLLERAATEAGRESARTSESGAVGLHLAAVLGEVGAVRDKLTFLTSASLRAFPDWLEQLVAESLGKNGRGLLPVADEPVVPAASYGEDRLFAAFVLDQDEDRKDTSEWDALEGRGHPVIRFRLRDAYDLGGQIFRWELAVAAAGSILGVLPFDQPDVELAKDLARKSMMPGSSPEGSPSGAEAVSAEDAARLNRSLEDWLAQCASRDYLAVQAYLNPDAETHRALQEVRLVLLQRTRLATTLGFGPRFLHSTGQYHKGGPNRGLFLQFVDEPGTDLPVPDTDYTFGRLIASQALGDYQALRRKERRVLRVNLKGDVRGGLERVRAALLKR